MNTINQRRLVIGGVLILVVVAVLVGLFFARTSLWPSADQQVASGEPVDVVLDFYVPWLEAAQSTTTTPYKLGLAKEPILSKELRKRLADSAKQPKPEIDPVLCQSTVPVQISARLVSKLADQAQVLIVSRDTQQMAQAVVTLLRYNEGWYINDITCTLGEFGPSREFSFDREGYLLKSVVPPLDARYWHLVFVEDGQPGHAAPLFFSTTSVCLAVDGSESVCDPNTFIDPSQAHVQGEMTELGVEVKRLQLTN